LQIAATITGYFASRPDGRRNRQPEQGRPPTAATPGGERPPGPTDQPSPRSG
jgi:hypothetical protein